MKRKLSNLQKGFTLIELLVVIAILGVLAAGIFTAINPIKRINQAKDAQIKNDIGQIAQAEQAYFTTKQAYTATVLDLVNVSGDLKTEPKSPDNTSYTVDKDPDTCTTAAEDCTEITVSYELKDPVTAGDLWCWKSSTGQATEVTAVVGCAAP